MYENHPVNTSIQIICPGHMISTGFYQEEFQPIKFGRMHVYVKQWNGIFVMYITNKRAHIVFKKPEVVNSNIHLPLKLANLIQIPSSIY